LHRAANPGGRQRLRISRIALCFPDCYGSRTFIKKGQIQDRRMREIRRRSLTLQGKLYKAIEEDSRSFDAVMEAFRLPREGEKERAYRNRMIQKSYQEATVAPQKVCDLSIQLLEYSEFLLREGNRNALSDTGVAAALADAALRGGLLNIRINLDSVKDRAFRKVKERLIRHLSRRRVLLMNAIRKTDRRYCLAEGNHLHIAQAPCVFLSLTFK